MKEWDQGHQDDPTTYLNEFTINSGFIPFYEFVDDLELYHREQDKKD